jgi:mannosyltransferase
MPEKITKADTTPTEPFPSIIGLVFLAVVAVIFRLQSLTQVSIWHNEALTSAITKLSWADFISHTQLEPAGNLYYILIKLWSGVFGADEFALRTLSVLLGIGVVAMIFVISRKIFNSNRIAYLATLLTAVSPIQIQYSQSAQSFCLTLLLALISCYALLTAIQTDKWKNWFVYALFTSAMFYSDISIWPVWLAHVMFLILTRPQPKLIKFLVGFLIPPTLIAIGNFSAIKQTIYEFELLGFNFYQVLNTLWQTLFGGFGTNRIVASIGVLIILTTILFFYKNLRQSNRMLLIWLLIASLFSAIFINFSATLDIPITLLVSSIALIIIIAGTINTIPNYSIRQTTSAILIGFCIFMVYKNQNDLNPSGKPGTSAAMSYVNDIARAQDHIYTNNPYVFFAIKHYNETEIQPILYLPEPVKFSGQKIISEQEITANWNAPQSNQNVWVIWSRGFNGSKPVVPGNWELIVENFYADTPDYKGLIVVSHYHIK